MLVSIISSGITTLVCLPYYAFYAISYYFLGLIAIIAARIIYKLRYEVFNEKDKMRPTRDRAIFITGATSGIGLALTRYFHRSGYTVIVGYLSKAEPGYKELRYLQLDYKRDPRVYFVELNVRLEESIRKSLEQVKDLLEENKLQLHALINNAGIGGMQRAHRDRSSAIRAIVETNLLGPMLMVRYYLPLLAKTKASRIVNVGSGIGFVPIEYAAVYGATKSGLGYYGASLALDIDRYDVKTVTVCPGNLIHNTSILISAEEQNARVTEELTDEERQIYCEELKEHQITFEKTIRAIKASQSGKERSLPVLKRLTIWCLNFISGSVSVRYDLNTTYVMSSFDNAIRLIEPPMEMHAGNFFYTIVLGSWLELNSHFNRYRMARFLTVRP